jgi:hypothetical protein
MVGLTTMGQGPRPYRNTSRTLGIVAWMSALLVSTAPAIVSIQLVKSTPTWGRTCGNTGVMRILALPAVFRTLFYECSLRLRDVSFRG